MAAARHRRVSRPNLHLRQPRGILVFAYFTMRRTSSDRFPSVSLSARRCKSYKSSGSRRIAVRGRRGPGLGTVMFPLSGGETAPRFGFPVVQRESVGSDGGGAFAFAPFVAGRGGWVDRVALVALPV